MRATHYKSRNRQGCRRVTPAELQRRVKTLRKPFEQVVRIETPQGVRAIASAEEAADLLLDTEWPIRGPDHRDASETCIKVLEGTRSTGDARNAFVRAAREAGILAA